MATITQRLVTALIMFACLAVPLVAQAVDLELFVRSPMGGR